MLAELASSGRQAHGRFAKFKHDPIEAHVLAIWNGTNLNPSADISEDQEIAVILDRTNFYAEMGGQVGDSGTLLTAGGDAGVAATGVSPLPVLRERAGVRVRAKRASFRLRSISAKALTLTLSRSTGRGDKAHTSRGDKLRRSMSKPPRVVGGYVLHIGRVRSGCLKVGDVVTAAVSPSRMQTMQNHTATHLANWALRETLGDGVQQKGSLVDPQKLRFDFSHGKSMSDAEIEKVETLVAEQIKQKLPVYAEEAPQDQALKINGLRAVFGEKYPPRVRVVSVGVPVGVLFQEPLSEKWRNYSIEFCGGTHLDNSSEVESFVITSEESVSKGVRRIVAPHRIGRFNSRVPIARAEMKRSIKPKSCPKAIFPRPSPRSRSSSVRPISRCAPNAAANKSSASYRRNTKRGRNRRRALAPRSTWRPSHRICSKAATS